MASGYDLPQNFLNRELSWLEFNARVFKEAQDQGNPLFERLKFLAITCSNLDEFFMIRVGSLCDRINAGVTDPDPAGLAPVEQLSRISVKAHHLMQDIYNCYNRSLRQALKKEQILFLEEHDLDKKQRDFLDYYYKNSVYPVLTPMVVDQSRRFPLILNRTLNVAVLLQDKNAAAGNDHIFATVQVPSVLDRLVEVPAGDRVRAFILLEELIRMKLDTLFTGHRILTSNCYRITRNADLTLDEEEGEDFLITIEQSLRQRKWGTAVRLEVKKGIGEELLTILETEVDAPKEQSYMINGPLDLTYLMKLDSLEGYEHLRYKPITPQPVVDFIQAENIFEAISKKDILVHVPYQSFDPVVDLVRSAASDPGVLAIKQTLYRVSINSPVVDALAQAADKGKQVTVLFELKARFDEENNMLRAKQLEKAGCHVIYGLVGLKIHCKLLLIVRREEDGIKRYVHMGTGNYNEVTARVYTDLSLFTDNPFFGADASAIFNMLSGYSEPTNLYKTTIAPLNLRARFLSLIGQEAAHARNGEQARIIAKVNSLVDQEIIGALYEASGAGVEIDLIVRGICCLRPGLSGVSERITVRSIVGRFLEHSRIFYFYNGGEEQIYLSSADWMKRNLDSRVEMLFALDDQDVKNRVRQVLDVALQDNVKSRILNPDGTYRRVDRRRKEIVDSQELLYNYAVREVRQMMDKSGERLFVPITSPHPEARAIEN
jgi:polyphosphate kinase